MEAAAFVAIPHLSRAVQAVFQIYDSVKNVKVYQDQCSQLSDQCTVLLITLRDHGERLIGTDFMEAIDETSSTLERISRKVHTWSNWSKPRSLFFQSEIKQGIDDMRKDLNDCATRFNIMSHIEILSSQQESRLVLAGNHAEMQEQLHHLLDSIRDVHAILKQSDPKIKDHMRHVQAAIHADVAEPEQRHRLQKHLLNIHRHRAELLPPMIDLTGEVRRITDHPINISGGYSDVYLGEWLGEEKVALKLTRGINQTPKAQKRFINEVAIWRQLQHRNVARLYGVATLGGHIYAVSPWMEHRDAIKYVENNPNADRLKLLREVATGLEFLHNHGVVHGDLRAANILISDTEAACITDFGLSVILEEEGEMQSTQTPDNHGNSRWMAPELIKPELIGLSAVKPNKATDVWSYGMLCLEILTGKCPFHDRARAAMVISDLIGGVRPARPPDQVTHRGLSDELWSLMQLCWHGKPESRPTMNKVVMLMRTLQASSQLQYRLHRPSSSQAAQASSSRSSSNQISNGREPSLPRQSSSISSLGGMDAIFLADSPSSHRALPRQSSSISSLGVMDPTHSAGSSMSFPGGSGSFGGILNTSSRIVSHTSSAPASPDYQTTPLSIVIPSPVEHSTTGRTRPSSAGVQSGFAHLSLTGENHNALNDIATSNQTAVDGPSSAPIVNVQTASPCGRCEPECFSNEAPLGIKYKDGVVTAGTLTALVERLIHTSSDRRRDMEFRDTFLVSYKAFTNAENVFNLLLERFDAASSPHHPPEQRASVRLAVLKVLISWLQGHNSQTKDIPLLERMRTFTRSVQRSSPAPTIDHYAGTLTNLIDTQVSALSKSPVLPVTPLSSTSGPRSPTFASDISPQALAQAVTALESERYDKIMPSDCIGWLVGEYENSGLSSFITENDRLSHWVIMSILKPDDQLTRCDTRKYFLSVAEECRKFRNYSSSSAIFAGLASSFITRLKRTSVLDRPNTKISAGMEKLLSASKNHQAYRKALKASTEPCIPMLRVHLRDIKETHSSHVKFITQDGHPNMVNFDLYHNLHKQIIRMLGFQHTPLKTPDDLRSRDIRTFIDNQVRSLVVDETLRRRLEKRANGLEREEHVDFISHTQELRASGFILST
ncbi:ras guanine nucleotide exchange factor domain-containing protein [Gautieria morchelliformis]|nr:ras guanine nucleotide exchange factor domain-containing protein [Gautieria morchelliformis]